MRRVLCAFGVGTALATIVAVVHLGGQVADPVIGTWELNLAKSKFSPGPAPQKRNADLA